MKHSGEPLLEVVYGVLHLGDLARMSDSDMLKMKNMGRGTFAEAKELLASHGLWSGMTSADLCDPEETAGAKTA